MLDERIYDDAVKEARNKEDPNIEYVTEIHSHGRTLDDSDSEGELFTNKPHIRYEGDEK